MYTLVTFIEGPGKFSLRKMRFGSLGLGITNKKNNKTGTGIMKIWENNRLGNGIYTPPPPSGSSCTLVPCYVLNLLRVLGFFFFPLFIVIL